MYGASGMDTMPVSLPSGMGGRALPLDASGRYMDVDRYRGLESFEDPHRRDYGVYDDAADRLRLLENPNVVLDVLRLLQSVTGNSLGPLASALAPPSVSTGMSGMPMGVRGDGHQMSVDHRGVSVTDYLHQGRDVASVYDTRDSLRDREYAAVSRDYRGAIASDMGTPLAGYDRVPSRPVDREPARDRRDDDRGRVDDRTQRRYADGRR
jgi:hypothetical protein